MMLLCPQDMVDFARSAILILIRDARGRGNSAGFSPIFRVHGHLPSEARQSQFN